jgi:hypothetical protein
MDKTPLHSEDLVVLEGLSLSLPWLRWAGWANIAWGVLGSLSIVFIIISWIPLWIGWHALRTEKEFRFALESNTLEDLEGALDHCSHLLRISTLLGLGTVLLASLVMVSAFAFLMWSSVGAKA